MQAKCESLTFRRTDGNPAFNCIFIGIFEKLKRPLAVQAFLSHVNPYCFSIVFSLFVLLIGPGANAQEVTGKEGGSKILMTQETYDSLMKNINRRAVIPKTSVATDSITQVADAVLHSVRLRIDSLTALGFATDSLLLRLNRTLNSPHKIEALFAFQKRLDADIKRRMVHMDTLRQLERVLKEKSDIIRELAADAGLPPTGKDLTPRLPGTPSDYKLPDIGNITAKMPEVTLALPPIKPRLPKDMLKYDSRGMNLGAKADALTNKVSNVTDAVTDGGEIIATADGYKEDMEKVRNEGLAKSEVLDELADKEALNVDQLKAFKEQNKGIAEVEAYRKLIEQYKEEKRIEEEIKAKVKELANDVIVENSAKVDASMKKIARIKRKFSDVPDVRNLPRHPPRRKNPLNTVY